MMYAVCAITVDNIGLSPLYPRLDVIAVKVLIRSIYHLCLVLTVSSNAMITRTRPAVSSKLLLK